MTEQKLCIDCKHCQKTLPYLKCTAVDEKLGEQDLVTGRKKWKQSGGWDNCETIRKMYCTPEGNWFEPKPPRRSVFDNPMFPVYFFVIVLLGLFGPLFYYVATKG